MCTINEKAILYLSTTLTPCHYAFSAGIDDAESECGLDQGVQFDWIINNDGDAVLLEKQLKELFVLAKNKSADNGQKSALVNGS